MKPLSSARSKFVSTIDASRRTVALTFLVFPAISVAAPFKADREFFFQECTVLNIYKMNAAETDAIRKGTTRLTDDMRSSLKGLLDVWEKFGDDNKDRLAYVLATVRRESSGTFQPIREAPKCGTDEICRERAIGRLLEERARKKGKPPRENYAKVDTNGQRYYGRGFLQLTLKENYRKTGKKLGIDLVEDPDKALDTKIAGEILVKAMLEGWYGSKKPLSYYINSSSVDWINARNNVNPNSPNKPITAGYAMDFARCLRPAS